jgi:vacuolar-type H+-ATPase subunit F/Vma7
MRQNRILLFKQAAKENRDKTFIAEGSEHRILDCIKRCSYVKSRHIQNILSESAKLAIRDFIDEITTRSNYKIELICAQIVEMYSQKVQALGRDVTAIIALKEGVIRLAEEIKAAQKESIIDILQREISKDKMQDFEEDFAAVMFFKGIYDKTSTYFSNLVNKIYS